jgi:hypothetical protein
MVRKLKTLLGVALILVSGIAVAQENVINKLKQGGHTIFFRHGITPGKDPHKINPPGESMFVCSTQRPLTDEGREQAKLIGVKFKEHNIPVGEVYASIICRSEETARLAFGKSIPVTWLVTAPTTRYMPELKKELLKAPAKGVNNIYVGHAHTLSDQMLGSEYPKIFLQEGEAVIFDPETKAIVGRIHPSKW